MRMVAIAQTSMNVLMATHANLVNASTKMVALNATVFLDLIFWLREMLVSVKTIYTYAHANKTLKFSFVLPHFTKYYSLYTLVEHVT